MKKGVAIIAVLTALSVPSWARAGSWGFGTELEVPVMGLTELQWTIDQGNGKKTYALTGDASMGMAPGIFVEHIGDRNLFVGLGAFYRTYGGSFQTPRTFSGNASVSFREIAVIARVGYMDFYSAGPWTPKPFSGESPTHGYGAFRLGFINSDIGDSADLNGFEPSKQGMVGLEAGAIFLPGGNFMVGLSGIVDYTFSVVPYKGTTDPSVENEILNNTLFFGFAIHTGMLTETPY